MIPSLRRTLAILGLLASTAACDRSTALPVSVWSLREAMPDLEEAGRTWRSDAYLAVASVNLRDGFPGTRVIDAGFQSPSEPHESLWVSLQEDGSIRTETIPHSVPVIQIAPITAEDWLLDSPEALEQALDEDGLRFLEEHTDSHCSFIMLERDPGLPGSPVVWRLTLTDCLGTGSVQHTILDPVTGEVISREQFGSMETAEP